MDTSHCSFIPPFRPGRQNIAAILLYHGVPRGIIEKTLPDLIVQAGFGETRNVKSLINATLHGLTLHGYQYKKLADGSYKITSTK